MIAVIRLRQFALPAFKGRVIPLSASTCTLAGMKAAIFDLDGTLVDSLGDIADAANHAMKELGHRSFTAEEYKTLAGGGNKKLMTRLLRLVTNEEPTEELVKRGIGLKRGYENGPLGHQHTKAFPGAHDMLISLQNNGIQLAVLSNKTETNVRAVVQQLFPDVQWRYVAGAKEDVPLKPDPTAALRIVEQHMPGIEPSDCIFVGDTDVDMKTGKSAGMMPLGVSWGFRSSEELIDNGAAVVVNDASDIVSFVLKQR